MIVSESNQCDECGNEDTLHYDKASGMNLCRDCRYDVSPHKQKIKKSRGNEDGFDSN